MLFSEFSTSDSNLRKYLDMMEFGPKWDGYHFSMNFAICSFSCHFLLILLFNVLSSFVILITQGMIYYRPIYMSSKQYKAWYIVHMVVTMMCYPYNMAHIIWVILFQRKRMNTLCRKWVEGMSWNNILEGRPQWPYN